MIRLCFSKGSRSTIIFSCEFFSEKKNVLEFEISQAKTGHA